MSSGWLSWIWYLTRMSYDNAIMSSGRHTLPFLSHPDEIANFNFPHHAVARQLFRSDEHVQRCLVFQNCVMVIYWCVECNTFAISKPFDRKNNRPPLVRPQNEWLVQRFDAFITVRLNKLLKKSEINVDLRLHDALDRSCDATGRKRSNRLYDSIIYFWYTYQWVLLSKLS